MALSTALNRRIAHAQTRATLPRGEILEDLQEETRIVLPGYIPQFDGLRGIAILGVFVAHSEFILSMPHAGFLEYGRVGVDLFFVLSGFLITGILLDSKNSPHYFRNFYARRSLRIWPLYYVVITIILLILPTVFGSTRGAGVRQFPLFALYVQNWFFHLKTPQAIWTTWSLAVEEQFYITWPLLVFLLGRRILPWVLMFAMGFSLALRIAGYEHHAPLEFIHNFTLSRLDPIAIGSLSAWWLRSPSCTRKRWRGLSYCAMVAGLCGVAVCRLLWHEQSIVVGYTFIALGFAGLLGISLVADTKRSLFGKVIASRWLCYTGKISYGLYLVHLPLFILWGQFVHKRNLPLQSSIFGNLGSTAIQFALAFLLATLSWRFFESPLLRLKKYFPSGSKVHRPALENDSGKTDTPPN
jgi:peptidoglycan/LPS O-acetylase OafA/YrhL